MVVKRIDEQLRRKIMPLTALAVAGLLYPGAYSRADEQAAQAASGTTGLSSAAAKTEGQVKANGITIAYESFGPTDRETILMIMGYGTQLTGWPPELCEELVKRGYRVIIYDNRDVGLSTKFAAAGIPDLNAIIEAKIAGKPAQMPYTLADMAKDAVGLLDALGIKKAHVVGVSMGGIIAQIVAAEHPGHTLSLTSIMAVSGNPAFTFPAKPEVVKKLSAGEPARDQEAIIANAVKMLQVLAGSKYPPDEKRLREVVIRSMKRSTDTAGMARQNAAVAVGLTEDRRERLKTIKVPTVVVHGADDPLMPLEGGKDTAANIPGAELRVIPGMGHDLPLPLVNTFADAITSAASRAHPANAPK